MRTYRVTAASDGEVTVTLQKEDDPAEFRPELLQEWEFDSRPVTAASMIEVLDACRADPKSRAYGLAYALCFAEAHCEAVRMTPADEAGSPGESVPVALADVPYSVLLAYDAQADISRVTTARFNALKKPKAPPSEGPNGAAPEVTTNG